MGRQGSVSAPPGWYPDPQWMGRERYWDGQTWTDESRPWTGKAAAMTEHVTVPARRSPRKALARGPAKVPARETPSAKALSLRPQPATPPAKGSHRPGMWPTTVTLVTVVAVLAGEAAIIVPLAYAAHLAWPSWGAPVPFAAWCGLALFTFLPAAQSWSARTHGCREPTASERSRLERPWRALLHRAGLRDRQYRLMVTDSDDLNACTPARRIVTVTTHAASLPTPHLEAVLAHELGHKRGLQSLPAFVTTHLTLPSRTLRWTLRTLWSPVVPMWKRAVAWHRPIGFLMVFLLAAVATTVTLLAALPAAVAYAATTLTRLSKAPAESEADRLAVRLGLGPELLTAVETHIENTAPSAALPLPLVQRAQHLRRTLPLT
ncbi:M48 family metalloprotease [Actinomadura sp. NPDC047616]|uniref:M48 family metalloprotease n=1 Tax=Actinomadura sp. NPDC047616 TaxID=3155914 RepID=UPI0033E77FE9